MAVQNTTAGINYLLRGYYSQNTKDFFDKFWFICYSALCKGGFFSESVMKFFQISKSQKKNIPKNYPELEI